MLELAVQTWIVLTVAAAVLLVVVIGTQAALRAARLVTARLRSALTATASHGPAVALTAGRR